MANATVIPIVNPYPFGVDNDQRREIVTGQFLVTPGTYPASSGIPILWDQMVSSPSGGPFQLETPYKMPAYAVAEGTDNAYFYTVEGMAGTLGGIPAYCSNVAITAYTATITCNNSFVANQTVTLNGFTMATFLNGQTVTIATANAAQFTFTSTTQTYSTAADTGIAYPAPILNNPQFQITSWSIASNVAIFVANNSLVAGQWITITGLVAGSYMNNLTAQVLSTSLSSTTFRVNFTHANVSSTTEPGLATVQTSFLGILPSAMVTNAAATSTSFFITSNVASVNATNTFSVGDQVLLQAFTTATYFNGMAATITAASGSQYSFNFVHANVGSSGSPTADSTGTATRTEIAVGATIPSAVLLDVITFEAEFVRG